MPIYEFVCEKCDTEFEELFMGVADGKKVKCPECGSSRTKKKFSSFAMSTGRSGGSLSGSECSSCKVPDCASRKR